MKLLPWGTTVLSQKLTKTQYPSQNTVYWSNHVNLEQIWHIQSCYEGYVSKPWPRFPDSIVLKDLRRLLRRVRLRRSAKIGVFPRLVLNCLLKIPPKKLLKKLLVGAKLNQSMPGKSITHHFIQVPLTAASTPDCRPQIGAGLNVGRAQRWAAPTSSPTLTPFRTPSGDY